MKYHEKVVKYQQENVILREALGVASARLDRQDLPASHLVYQAKVIIDEALQKTGGKE